MFANFCYNPKEDITVIVTFDFSESALVGGAFHFFSSHMHATKLYIMNDLTNNIVHI